MAYQRDRDRLGKELSFQDFFQRLQSGGYSRPTYERPANAETGEGAAQFCEQIMFTEEDAAAINSIDEFRANESKLKAVRIRQVTGGGNFSSDTKAKFTLNIPLKMTYVVRNKPGPPTYETKPMNLFGTWVNIQQPVATTSNIPDTSTVTVKTMTVFYPCPVRIENVQYDGVVTLNDPADADTDVVVMIPLTTSNSGSDTTDFFTRILKQVTSVSTPDSVTGLFQGSDIATGNNWNLKSLFTLVPQKDTLGNVVKDEQTGEVKYPSPAKVANAYFTWTAAPTYRRVRTADTPGFINYTWEPDGKTVRYFMLQYPASVNSTDMAILTRNLPPTPSEKAIHTIPDSLAGSPKILYKASEPPALEKECGIKVREGFVGGVREHMQSLDVIDSMLNTGDVSSLLTGADGTSVLQDSTNKCDPFALNAKNAKSFAITPADATKFFFNFLILISLAVGAWLALWSVTKDYDGSYKNFATDAGKVLGTIALRSTNQVKNVLPVQPTAEAAPSTPGSSLLGRLNPFAKKL